MASPVARATPAADPAARSLGNHQCGHGRSWSPRRHCRPHRAGAGANAARARNAVVACQWSGRIDVARWRYRLAVGTAHTGRPGGQRTDAMDPADPRLRGAALELDAARMELDQALTQAPHSPALRRLLTRTERQLVQLREQTHEAG